MKLDYDATSENCVGINLKSSEDEYYLRQSVVASADPMPFASACLSMPLDRAIELRDGLTKIIDERVAKIQAENSDPIAVDSEVGEVLDSLNKIEEKT